MWEKIDSSLNILPEKNPPVYLADCFLREDPRVRSMSLVVSLALMSAKLMVVSTVILLALYR